MVHCLNSLKFCYFIFTNSTNEVTSSAKLQYNFLVDIFDMGIILQSSSGFLK